MKRGEEEESQKRIGGREEDEGGKKRKERERREKVKEWKTECVIKVRPGDVESCFFLHTALFYFTGLVLAFYGLRPPVGIVEKCVGQAINPPVGDHSFYHGFVVKVWGSMSRGWLRAPLNTAGVSVRTKCLCCGRSLMGRLLTLSGLLRGGQQTFGALPSTPGIPSHSKDVLFLFPGLGLPN